MSKNVNNDVSKETSYRWDMIRSSNFVLKRLDNFLLLFLFRLVLLHN